MDSMEAEIPGGWNVWRLNSFETGLPGARTPKKLILADPAMVLPALDYIQ